MIKVGQVYKHKNGNVYKILATDSITYVSYFTEESLQIIALENDKTYVVMNKTDLKKAIKAGRLKEIKK